MELPYVHKSPARRATPKIPYSRAVIEFYILCSSNRYTIAMLSIPHSKQIEPPRVYRRLLMYSNRSHYEQYKPLHQTWLALKMEDILQHDLVSCPNKTLLLASQYLVEHLK